MYIRKTYDEYEIQGYYVGSWEVVTTEGTYKEAKEQLKTYNKNEAVPHRIVKKRIKKAATK